MGLSSKGPNSCKLHVAPTAMAMLINSLGNIHLLKQVIELDIGQRFCKAICNYLFNWNVEKLDSLGGYLIADIMMLDIDMFCARVEY